MKSFSLMVPIAPKNQRGPLKVPYMSSMSHTSGIDLTNGSYASKFDELPSSDNVGGVGDRNRILLFSKSSSKLVSKI
jgi:hypothetical protein